MLTHFNPCLPASNTQALPKCLEMMQQCRLLANAKTFAVEISDRIDGVE